MTTKKRLADRLFAHGWIDLAGRAASGEFSDFESEHATPKILLISALNNIGTREAMILSDEVIEGKWDDTKEEGEAWFAKEGKDLLL